MNKNCLLCISVLTLLGFVSCREERGAPLATRQVVKSWPNGKPRYVLFGDSSEPPFIGEEYYESGILKSRWRFDTEGAGSANEYDARGRRMRHIVFKDEAEYADVWFFAEGGSIRFFAHYDGMLTANEYVEYYEGGRKTVHRLIPILEDGKLGKFPPAIDPPQEQMLLGRWLKGDWYAWEWLIRSNIPVKRRAWYLVDGMRKRAEDKGKEEGPHCLSPSKLFERLKKNCGKEMLPNLVALLSHPDPEVRVHASGLLGKIHGVTLGIACAAPALASLLDHDSQRVRDFAAWRLGTIAGKRFGYDAGAARDWWESEGTEKTWPQPPQPTTRKEILAEVGIESPPDEDGATIEH